MNRRRLLLGAGSATDQGARNIAEGLNRTFGVPAVVENKPGANSDEVASERPVDKDGPSRTARRPADGLRAGVPDRPRAEPAYVERQEQGGSEITPCTPEEMRQLQIAGIEPA